MKKKKKTDIIDSFLRRAKKSEQQLPRWTVLYAPWTVKILAGNFPPEIDTSDFKQFINIILVGKEWLTDRMWSKIVAARIKGEIEIKQESEILWLVRCNKYSRGYIDWTNLSQSWSSLGVSMDEASSSLIAYTQSVTL